MATGRAGSSRLPAWLRLACVVVSALLIAAWVVDVWRVGVRLGTVEGGCERISLTLAGFRVETWRASTPVGPPGEQIKIRWRSIVEEVEEGVAPPSSTDATADARAYADLRGTHAAAGLVRVMLILTLIWLSQVWLPVPGPGPSGGQLVLVSGVLQLLLAAVAAWLTFGGVMANPAWLAPPTLPLGPSSWLLLAALLLTACMFAAALIGRRRAARASKAASHPPTP